MLGDYDDMHDNVVWLVDMNAERNNGRSLRQMSKNNLRFFVDFKFFDCLDFGNFSENKKNNVFFSVFWKKLKK